MDSIKTEIGEAGDAFTDAQESGGGGGADDGTDMGGHEQEIQSAVADQCQATMEVEPNPTISLLVNFFKDIFTQWANEIESLESLPPREKTNILKLMKGATSCWDQLLNLSSYDKEGIEYLLHKIRGKLIYMGTIGRILSKKEASEADALHLKKIHMYSIRLKEFVNSTMADTVRQIFDGVMKGEEGLSPIFGFFRINRTAEEDTELQPSHKLPELPQGTKILILDDDEGIVTTTYYSLRQIGANVKAVSDQSEFDNLLQSEGYSPDLILLDNSLWNSRGSVVWGHELISKLKEAFPNSHIVGHTSSSERINDDLSNPYAQNGIPVFEKHDLLSIIQSYCTSCGIELKSDV